MPRAPFDVTATFLRGPGQSSPGAVRFFGPARLVLADGISQVGTGAPSVIGWVTTESGIPVGGWVSDKLGLNAELSDQVAIGSDPVSYFVLWVERVQWKGADYYRASLAGLPLPDCCECSAPPPPPPDYCAHYNAGGVSLTETSTYHWEGYSGMGDHYVLVATADGSWTLTIDRMTGSHCVFTTSGWDGHGDREFAFSSGSGDCEGVYYVSCAD